MKLPLNFLIMRTGTAVCIGLMKTVVNTENQLTSLHGVTVWGALPSKVVVEPVCF